MELEYYYSYTIRCVKRQKTSSEKGFPCRVSVKRGAQYDWILWFETELNSQQQQRIDYRKLLIYFA